MRLTAATQAAFVKYPWTRNARPQGKYGINHSEWSHFSELADRVGLTSIAAQRVARHPLVYLLEAADDACYSVIDIEDAVEMRVLPFEQARDLFLPLIDPAQHRSLQPLNEHQFLYRCRGLLIDQMEEATLRGFQQCYEPIMRGEEVGDVMSVGDPNQIARTLKRFAAAHVYSSDEKQLHQSRAHTKLQTILGAMMGALYERFLAVVSVTGSVRGPRSH